MARIPLDDKILIVFTVQETILPSREKARIPACDLPIDVVALSGWYAVVFICSCDGTTKLPVV